METTKVQAIVELLKANGGRATWQQIYHDLEKYYPKAKASAFWQEGIRGVVYREMRYGRNFELVAKGIVGLKD